MSATRRHPGRGVLRWDRSVEQPDEHPRPLAHRESPRVVLVGGELLEPGVDLERLVVPPLQRERLDQVGGDREGPGLQEAGRDHVVEDRTQQGLGRLGLARLKGGHGQHVVGLEPVPHVAERLRVLTGERRPFAGGRDVAVPHRDHGPHDLQGRGLVRAEVDVQQRVQELPRLADASAALQDVEQPLPVGLGLLEAARLLGGSDRLAHRPLGLGQLTAPDEPLPERFPVGGFGRLPAADQAPAARATDACPTRSSSCAPSSIASSAQARHSAAFPTEMPPAMKRPGLERPASDQGVVSALGERAVHEVLGVGDGAPRAVRAAQQRLAALRPVRHPLDLRLEEVGQPLGLVDDRHPVGEVQHPPGAGRRTLRCPGQGELGQLERGLGGAPVAGQPSALGQGGGQLLVGLGGRPEPDAGPAARAG